MRIEIDPYRSPKRRARYCSGCEEKVMDVYSPSGKRHCPKCGRQPTLLELGTNINQANDG